ncbi:hypothetical protein HDU82_009150 [Entophlyctis luteolus]|nr:hypothetical protein HDU82_009150 [Entophlyctis luteolus]
MPRPSSAIFLTEVDDDEDLLLQFPDTRQVATSLTRHASTDSQRNSDSITATTHNTIFNAEVPSVSDNDDQQIRNNKEVDVHLPPKKRLSVHWKDHHDFPNPQPNDNRTRLDDDSPNNTPAVVCSFLGNPLITWQSCSSAGFGRVRFEKVDYVLSQKQAARLKPAPNIDCNSAYSGGGAIVTKTADSSETAIKLTYKIVTNLDAGILRATLANAGFREVSGGSLINRFPKISENERNYSKRSATCQYFTDAPAARGKGNYSSCAQD